MSAIDRLRYYDGEFLRAFDFGDEQTYHVEMRRRLNRYLHLYGIVQGLQLSEDVEASIHQVSILPGFAIDAFGREIYVFAPYTLGDSDVTNNRISAAGNYDVWIRYNKTAATPPSSGYGVCNQADQYTRWVESYSVVLLPSPSSPFTDPAFTDDDSDTPGQDQVGILLGTVAVDPNSVTLQFSSPTFHHRHFLGVIAQRIQTPPGYDATQSYKFLQKNTAHSPAVSLAIEPNIFARQNLILGPDFDLTGATISPAASTNTSGSAKVASDLFVQGNLYSNVVVSGVQKWLGLSQYVQTLVQQFLPEIVIGQTPVGVNNTPVNAGLAAATAQIAVNTTRLTNVSSAIPLASFSQIQTADQTDLNALFATGAIQIGITTPPTVSFVGQNGNVNVSWQAGPASGGPPTTKCAIQNFTISCVVICFP